MRNDPEEFDYRDDMEPPPIQRKKKRKRRKKSQFEMEIEKLENAPKLVYDPYKREDLTNTRFNIFEVVGIILFLPAYIAFCSIFVGVIILGCMGFHKLFFGNNPSILTVIVTMTICGIIYTIVGEYVLRLWRKIFG